MTEHESSTELSAPNRFAVRPIATLAATAVVVAISLFSALGIEPDASMKSMLARNNVASQALIRVIEAFPSVNDLIILVDVDPEAPPRTPTGAAPRDLRHDLVAFAKRFEAQVRADAEAQKLILEVQYRADNHWQQFVEREVAPKTLLYLDDEQFESFRQRLSTEEIHNQIRRNESMISAPGIAGKALSKQLLGDPLRLFEFTLMALGPLPTSFSPDGSQSPLLSRDGRALMIRVAPTRSSSDFDFNRELMVVARRLVAQAQPDDLRVVYTGAHAIAEHSEKYIRGDMVRSVNGSILILAILFLLVYRSMWSFLIIFLTIGSGIIAGFGVYSLISTRLSPVAGASGAILTGLGVDYCIHTLTWYENRRGMGMGPLQAISLTGRFAWTLVIVCVTSVIGFGTIATSSVPAVASFGLLGAIGLGTVLLATLTVMPGLLGLIDRRGTMPRRSLRNLTRYLTPLITGHPRICLGSSVLLFAIASAVVAISRGPGFNADSSLMQPSPNPPLEAQSRVQRQFNTESPSSMIYLHADSPEDLLIKSHAVRERCLSGNPDLVQATLGLASLLPDPNRVEPRRARSLELDVDRIVADFREAVDASVFSFDAYGPYLEYLKSMLRPGAAPTIQTLRDYPELARSILPATSFVDDGQDPVEAISLAFLNTGDSEGEEWLKATQALQSRLDGIQGAVVADISMVSYEVQQTIRSDLKRLLLIAAGLVVVWLLLMLRSMPLVLLSITPALFGTVCLLAMMSLTQIELNLINLVSIPLIIGLGVDDGIFLVKHSSDGLIRPSDDPESPRNGLAVTVLAIFMTSVTTIAAFGSLALTSTPAIRSLGFTVALGMTACFVGAVFVLLPILLLRDRRARTGPD